MTDNNGIRKVLVVVLTCMTLGCVLLAVKKFGKKTEQGKSSIVKKSQDGGSSKLPSDKGPPIVEGTLDQALAAITEANLRTNLTHLASAPLEGRMSGKAGNKQAADWIENQFRSFGLETMRHKFKMSRFNPGPKNETGDDFSENIYGILEGSDPNLKDEIVVVGAHMDHLGYGPKGSQTPNRKEIHPGADDNASGTVALIEISRACAMMKSKIRRTTVFMAFSGEEMGLIGSQFYVRNPVFPKSGPSIQKHVAMLNMDMIGRLKSTVSDSRYQANYSSADLDKIINSLSAKYPFAKGISGRSGGGSDHAPFYNAKVPVVCLHTGMHKQYHTPEDSADRINYRGLEQIARYAFELSYNIASSADKPRFNYGQFKRMRYDRDHDEGGYRFRD